MRVAPEGSALSQLQRAGDLMAEQAKSQQQLPASVWLMLLFLVVAVFYVGIRTGGFNIPLERLPWSILVPVAALFCIIHSTVMLGPPRALLLLVLCVTISFGFEYVGERTGAIFGPYFYTDLLGFKLFGRIPLLIPLAWYMMFYPSYVVTNLLAEGNPTAVRTGIAWIAWMSALSALVMTAWDLTMDPIMSYHPCATGSADCLPATLDEANLGHPAWIWRQGGEHFGVPLLNYGGWLMTAFVVFLLFRWLETRLPHRPWRGAASRLMAWLPVGLYGGMAAIDTWLGYPEIGDIHLISPFAMGIPALFATFQIFANRIDLPLWPHHDDSAGARSGLHRQRAPHEQPARGRDG